MSFLSSCFSCKNTFAQSAISLILSNPILENNYVVLRFERKKKEKTRAVLLTENNVAALITVKCEMSSAK